MEKSLSFLLRDSGKVCGFDSHFQDSDYDRETSQLRNGSGDHCTLKLQAIRGVERDERVIRKAVEKGVPVRALF
jgi:hypothetical protein